MKKLISCILLLALCLSLFAGCKQGEDADLAKAKELLYTMYKESGVKTTVDYTVVSQIRVGTTTYPITWTADVAEDLVKITKDASGMTLIDVNETPSADVNYTLTGTLTNAKGETAAVGFKHLIPKALSYKEIVDQAYALEAGKTLDGVYTLKGVISAIDTPWSPDYKNITVTINVEGVEGKPIMCYRLKGNGADALKVGDTITVKGSLTNYNGTIEYAAGCELLSVVAGNVEQKPGYDPTGKTQDEIIDAAYQLDQSESMLAEATLTGVISSIDTAWSDQYSNITVTIKCAGKEDKPIQCFRLKGDGAQNLKVGDTITVTGTLINYKGTVQFNAGCVVKSIVAGEGGSTPTTPPTTDPTPTTPPATEPSTDGAQLSISEAITMGAAKEHNTYTTEKYSVTGVITEVYNDVYGNMKITDGNGNILTIYGTYSADGSTRYDAMATKPVAGDTVTILGIVGQYNNTPQIKNGWIVAHTPGSGSSNTTPPATEPAPTNPSVDVPAGNSIVFDFSSLDKKGVEITEGALDLFNAATTSSSNLTAVTLTKVYNGNGTGGAYPETSGMLKCGTGKVDGKLELTFSKKVAKVEIVCHDWYTKSNQYPTNSNTISVNGSAAQLAPYTENATAGTLTFELASSSNTVAIELDNTSGSFGRAFIFKIIVTFAG